MESNQSASSQSTVAIAIAIIVAGLLIAGAIIVKSYFDSTSKIAANQTTTTSPTANVDIAPVTSKDHILGNPQARILFIEYSDLECPFCKQFQGTLQQMMTDFGASGQVAWVYRQFPLYRGTPTQPALHPKAGKEAEASECAAELGGNDAFWAYINKIYDITPSNNGLDPSELYTVAADIGLNANAFQTCLDSGKYAQTISDDYDAAVAAGGQGTPYSVILDTKTGETTPITQGAIPYAQLKPILEAILAK